jgi:hypothetical protein
VSDHDLTYDSIDAMDFQGLNPNVAPYLLEMLDMEIRIVQCPNYFHMSLDARIAGPVYSLDRYSLS